MVQNLKRKRADKPGPRKIQRAEEKEPEFEEEVVHGEDDVDIDHEGDAEESERSGAEEWAGVDEEPSAQRSGKTKPKKERLPTALELREIKDASDLFKSGSFKLQMDALLPNVRPKASRVPPLERFLFALHSLLKGLPSIPPQHPLEAARKLLKKGVAVPYSLPLPNEDTKWKVAFDPPSDIALVGSWANKISVKPKDSLAYGVDLVVEMPNSLFQEKDYLNGRFFHKRSFYLATIAAAIQKSKSDLEVEVEYESLQGDPRLTKLILKPRKNDSATDFTKLNAKVCVIPILAFNSPIPLHRLSPSHSNLRINTNEDSSHDESTPSTNLPTPIYNNAILHAFLPKPHLLAVHALQNDIPAFSDALTLLRIWANQRGYSEGTKWCIRGFESVGPWWWSILSLLLTGEEPLPGATKFKMRKPIGKGLSSFQLFKASLEFLAKHNFEKDFVFVKCSNGHRYPPEDYKEFGGPVFVDSSSMNNVLAGVPLGSLDMLRYDATKSLEILNQPSFSGDPFTHVFLKDGRDLPTRFDVVLRVNLSSAKPRKISTPFVVDFGSPSNSLLASISSILRDGLGDRCRAVAILHPSSGPRSISQAHPSSPDIIFIGIIHNPQNAFRLVDHGPAADEQDQTVLEKFRDFWGDKSELRRFKDGRIVESVVWEVATADERTHVPSMVVRHLLKRHFSLEDDAVEMWQTSFDSLLRLPSLISRDIISSGVSTGFKGALTAFDDLVKSIRKLDDDLPLALLNVSPVSEFLRYTSVFSPVSIPTSLLSVLPPNARFLGSIDMVLEFEKSSRWPDDIKAVQTIKLAFFERIATKLMGSVEGLKAKVVIGDGVHDSLLQDKSFLEIVTPDGWAFNARIWHDREVNLLDQVIGGKASLMPHIVSKKKEKKTAEYYEAVNAKEIYMRRFIHGPRHHRAIAALSHHYSAFAGTVRLSKRWLASHWLLHNHISEEIVEIICASLFVGSHRSITAETDTEKTAQHLVPASKERGFASFVLFLRDWKWEEGLNVPLYGAQSEVKSTNSSQGLSRKSVWKVSTEHDMEGHVWTHKGPDLLVANRVRALADATWKYMLGMESGHLDVQGIFMHPTDDYDFLLDLDPSVLPRYLHNVNANPALLTKRGKYANKSQEDDNAEIYPGFDPVSLFMADLQRVYADTFKVFHDPFGGTQIGAVWDPTLKVPRPFRVLGGFSCLPIKKENEKGKDKGLVGLNQDAVVAEIERMGDGLVKKITVTEA